MNINLKLDINKDSEGKDQGNSFVENPSQQQRKEATKTQKSQQQQQQQSQQQQQTNDKSNRERDKDRQKEFEKEAEREKERLREKEIKAFREFSTLLPFKQNTAQQPRRLPGSSYLNTPDLDPIDDHLVPSSSSNNNNIHNGNYNNNPNNNSTNMNMNMNMNNGGTGQGLYSVGGHVNLGPLGENSLASNLIHNTGGRLRNNLGASGVSASTPLGINSINRPQIPSIQLQQTSHTSSQQNLNNLLLANNMNSNMPPNQTYRQQPLGQIPHQNLELSPSSTQIGISSKYKENHNSSQNNDNNNSMNNMNNNMNSVNLVDKEYKCTKNSNVQSIQNSLNNSGYSNLESKNIQNGISPRKGDVNFHFENELSNNNHVNNNNVNNNSNNNNNNSNNNSSSSSNISSHLEPLESLHAPQTLPQIHGRDSNPDINITDLKIPSLVINQNIRNNGNNNQYLLNSRHNSNSNMSLSNLNTPINRNNDKEKERNDLKISNNGSNNSNHINSGRGAKSSGNRNQNHSHSQDKQNLTQKHR